MMGPNGKEIEKVKIACEGDIEHAIRLSRSEEIVAVEIPNGAMRQVFIDALLDDLLAQQAESQADSSAE